MRVKRWVCVCVHAGVSEGRDPAAELTEDDPREQKAKHQIEQVWAFFWCHSKCDSHNGTGTSHFNAGH